METKQEQLETIYESYVNGQLRQALEQAKEYGLYDFSVQCVRLHTELGIPKEEVLEMFRCIMTINFR